MTNNDLAADYLLRAKKRLSAIDALWKEEAWADVVRESQEVVELALKGLLRHSKVLAPHTHDVSNILVANRGAIAHELQPHIDEFAKVSRALRRDREMAFYGSEDLTPSEFYNRDDADIARSAAQKLVGLIHPVVTSRN